jgi:hypothetical protein
MGKQRDGIWLGGIGSDIFGEVAPARIDFTDRPNDYLVNLYLRSWFSTARKEGRLHKDFEKDLKDLWWKNNFYKFLYVTAGVVFAGVVYNPNYTSRNSFYLRKFTPLFFGAIGYQFYKAQHSKKVTQIMMKNNDYYPLEVKRCLQDKDFRHMVDFNLQKRPLYSEQSGKAL